MSFEGALSTWLTFLSSLGFDASSYLNPPATAAQLDAAEAEIGAKLPEDLRALYLSFDGQPETLGASETSSGLIVPFFGGYDFSPLQTALANYRGWRDIYDDAGEDFDADFNQGMITVRDGDAVFAEYWRPGWFPFSVDGGGHSYAVDLSPAPGGAYGQIILIGPDEDQRRVLAPRLTAFLQEAAARRPGIAERHGNWASFDAEAPIGEAG